MWLVWVEYLIEFFNSKTHLYVNHWVPQISIANLVYRTVTNPTCVVSFSLLFMPFPPQNNPQLQKPKIGKISKPVCVKAQHHKSKWCSSSSSWTYLCNIPVPLSFWTWLKDLVAPHFVASTALDHSLISNSRNPHEGILNSQLWTQPRYPMLLIFLTFNL